MEEVTNNQNEPVENAAQRLTEEYEKMRIILTDTANRYNNLLKLYNNVVSLYITSNDSSRGNN